MLLGGSQGTVKNSGSGFGQTGAGTQLHFGGREKNIVPLSAHFFFYQCSGDDDYTCLTRLFGGLGETVFMKYRA